jgi:hypothetical protein
MSKMVLQQLGVLALAIIFSILCMEMNSRKLKNSVKKKAKPDAKKSGAL